MTDGPETSASQSSTLMLALEALRKLAVTPPTTLADWKKAAADMAAMRQEVVGAITPLGRRTPEFREFKGLYEVFRAHYETALSTINSERAARIAERERIVAEMEALARSTAASSDLLVRGQQLRAQFEALATRDQGYGEAAARLKSAWDHVSAAAETVPIDDAALEQRRSQLKLVAIDGVARSIKAANILEADEAVQQLKAVWPRIGPSGPLDTAFDQIFADHCRRFREAVTAARRKSGGEEIGKSQTS